VSLKLTREAFRLGTTIARLKLKGKGGDLDKRWSMWFNAILRAKSYQFLYPLKFVKKIKFYFIFLKKEKNFLRIFLFFALKNILIL
jgi:hypothetical protein